MCHGLANGSRRQSASQGLRGWLLMALLLAGRAHAHPSAAAPPVFYEDGCLTVIDKEAGPTWHLEYRIPVEDTEFGAYDIRLPDGKSHQFFAVAGKVFMDEDQKGAHVVIPFDDREGKRRLMPLWLSADDIERSAAAVIPADKTEFTVDQVAPETVLGHDPAVAARLYPFSPETQRVPITADQASKGVNWALGDVPAGSYQIVAYIFSPPFNGWAVRPGVVKVRSRQADPPSVSLDSVAGVILGGQGRRITGCAQGPAGSTLEVAVRGLSTSTSSYEVLDGPHRIVGDRFDICLPNGGVDASVGVRVELLSPDGRRSTVHSQREVTLLQRPSSCEPGTVLCCPGAADGPAASTEEGTGKAAEARQSSDTQPSRDAGAADLSSSDAAVDSPTADSNGGGGCRIAAHRSPGTSQAALLALLIGCWLTRSCLRRGPG